MPNVRSIAAVFLLAQAAAGFAQSPDDRLFDSIRPDVSFVIREHATSADLVEVTALNADYPADLLRRQLQAMGELLGSMPRGLHLFRYQMDPEKPSLTFLKATFAVDGLIDRRRRVLRLSPILKAFAGAPEANRIQGISVLFAGETPNENVVRRFSSEALTAIARVIEQPPGIEYRVALRKQDPKVLDFPDERVEPSTAKEPSLPQTGPPAYTWVAIGVAGIAAGALVYSLLRRRS